MINSFPTFRNINDAQYGNTVDTGYDINIVRVFVIPGRN